MEEIVRAFNFVIDQGWVCSLQVLLSLELTGSPQAFYWATSEWSAREIEEAYRMLRVSLLRSQSRI